MLRQKSSSVPVFSTPFFVFFVHGNFSTILINSSIWLALLSGHNSSQFSWHVYGKLLFYFLFIIKFYCNKFRRVLHRLNSMACVFGAVFSVWLFCFQLHAERHYRNYQVLINGTECIKQIRNNYLRFTSITWFSFKKYLFLLLVWLCLLRCRHNMHVFNHIHKDLWIAFGDCFERLTNNFHS